MAAHSQQTAEFIKGDYGGGSAELFVSVCLLLWRQALLSALCPYFTKKFACQETPSQGGPPKPDQIQPSPALSQQMGFCFLEKVKVRVKNTLSLCAGSFVKSLKMVLLLVLIQKMISLPQELSV